VAAALVTGIAWGLLSIRSALAQPADGIPPVAYAGPDQAVGVIVTVALNGSGSYDPDNELPLSYHWAQTGGPAVTFTPTLSMTAFTAPAIPVVLTFTLVVTDSTGMPDPTPDEVLIRVLGQPVAEDDSGLGFITNEDTPFVTGDVLGNDSDSTGGPLWVQSFDTSKTIGQVSPAVPAGGLDTAGFGVPNGYVITDTTHSVYVSAVAIRPNGKIIVAGDGGGNYFGLAGYNPDGSKDAAFGNAGVVRADFGVTAYARDVAVQQDARIIELGFIMTSYDTYDFALARYTPDGWLDTSFDNDGKVVTDFGAYDMARSMGIQTDGKIIAAGYTYNGDVYDFALARYNPDGSLDATFGSGGKVTTDFGQKVAAYDVTIQPDGKIVAAGITHPEEMQYHQNFVLARYNSDGSLDATFGSGGKLITDFGFSTTCNAIAVQPDGKIIAAGFARFPNYELDFFLARYNPDGSLDTDFGNAGQVVTAFDGVSEANAMALQPDGKIVLAGLADSPHTFALARYNPDGSLDTSFGIQGKVVTSGFSGSSNTINAIALQSDGNLIAAGYEFDSGQSFTILARYIGAIGGTFAYDPNGQFGYLNAGETATDNFTYLLTNGVLTDTATVTITVTGVDDPLRTLLPAIFKQYMPGPDQPPVAVDDSGPAFTTDANTAFVTGDVLLNDFDPRGARISLQSFDASGTLGQVALASPAGNLDSAGFNAPYGYKTISLQESRGVAIQSDNKIVIAGFSDSGSPYYGDFALARYNPDGSTDMEFGTAGIVTTDFAHGSDQGYAVAIQPDHKIIVAGQAWYNGTSYAGLARFNPDGSLDTTFGFDGKVLTRLGRPDNCIYSLAIQPDGMIIASGNTYSHDPYLGEYYYAFAMARYNPDGSLDDSFGSSGIVMIDSGSSSYIRDITLQADGKILVAGAVGIHDEIVVERYNADGSLDITFGSNGQATARFYGISEVTDTVAVQPDGKIFAAGSVRHNTNEDIAVARFNPDGSHDPTFGSAGKVTTETGNFGRASDLAIQPDGRIIATGNIANYSAIVRYNPDGSPDTTFGENGIVTSDTGYTVNTAVALQSDGNLVTTWGLILARYLGRVSNGTFTYNPNGQFNTLAPGETATDTFTYVITNGVLTDTATVFITITGVGDASLVGTVPGQIANTPVAPMPLDRDRFTGYLISVVIILAAPAASKALATFSAPAGDTRAIILLPRPCRARRTHNDI
jgi:uncharacterized delta-60 repeat protein